MKTKTPSLKTLIKSHKFDWVNSDIEKHFTLEDIRSSEYKLYHFDKYISSDDAIKEMEKEGYLPANLHELLLWKDWNEKDYVVALGSVGEVRGRRSVPYLDRHGSERDLGLRWYGGEWRSLCRFLAVRNLDSSDTSPSDLGNSDTFTLDRAVEICKEAGYVIYKPI